MAELKLNAVQINAGLHHVRRIAMAQDVRGNPLVDTSSQRRQRQGFLKAGDVQGLSGSLPLEQVRPSRPSLLPAVSQPGKQAGAHRDEAILVALCLANVDDTALRVDIDDLQSAGLTQTQSRAIAEKRNRVMHDGLQLCQQRTDFRATEDSWQSLMAPNTRDPIRTVRSIQHDPIEE
jgi:hypothetical protein